MSIQRMEIDALLQNINSLNIYMRSNTYLHYIKQKLHMKINKSLYYNRYQQLLTV